MALVLTLKAGDFLFIGPDIAIRIVSKKGSYLGLAIEAPLEFKIETSFGLRKRLERKQKGELA